MTAAASTFPREPVLAPRSEDGLGAGALMAVVVHIGLLLALAFGVNWHASEPEGVSAELWAAVPQVAAPREVAPPPEPVPVKPQPRVVEPPKPTQAEPQQQRDAEIAIEKERKLKQQRALEEKEEKEKARLKAEKEKAEKDKAEANKLAKAKADAEAKKKQQQDEQRLAKQREENLKRMMGEAGGTGAPTATGKAARDAGPSASYAGRIKARIKPNIVFTDEIAGNPEAEAELRVAPDGTILSRRITRSSGVKGWDDAVLRAIDRTEVLPRDIDGRVPSSMTITFKPKD